MAKLIIPISSNVSKEKLLEDLQNQFAKEKYEVKLRNHRNYDILISNQIGDGAGIKFQDEHILIRPASKAILYLTYIWAIYMIGAIIIFGNPGVIPSLFIIILAIYLSVKSSNFAKKVYQHLNTLALN